MGQGGRESTEEIPLVLGDCRSSIGSCRHDFQLILAVILRIRHRKLLTWRHYLTRGRTNFLLYNYSSKYKIRFVGNEARIEDVFTPNGPIPNGHIPSESFIRPAHEKPHSVMTGTKRGRSAHNRGFGDALDRSRLGCDRVTQPRL
jgi:hypothetical protein